jgi:ribosome-associated heat shock protein Hsp15
MTSKARQTAFRVDKWLWAARFYKTRSLAAEAVDRGQVLVAAQRVKPARILRIGEPIVIQRGDERIEIVIRALSDLRGPAAVAQQLYEETVESRERRRRRAEVRRLAPEPAITIKGRPSKRDRRELTRLTDRASSGDREQ